MAPPPLENPAHPRLKIVSFSFLTYESLEIALKSRFVLF